MGEIKTKIILKGLKQEKEYDVVVDTASDVITMPEKIAEELGIETAWEGKSILGDTSETKGKRGVITLKKNGCEYPFLANIIKETAKGDILLGATELQVFGAKIDMTKDTVDFTSCHNPIIRRVISNTLKKK